MSSDGAPRTASRVPTAAATELRAYAYVDRMQPNFAAYIGSIVAGDPPVAGMAELYVELAPGNEVFRLADAALKSADVRPGWQIVEREFGMLELHGFSPDAARHAGEAILELLGVEVNQRKRAEIASMQTISNVDPYQAQLINRMKRGSLLVPGETLFILELAPAAYATIAANEAEKAADIKIVEVSVVGRFGRIFLTGSESEVRAAREAAVAAVSAIVGV